MAFSKHNPGQPLRQLSNKFEVNRKYALRTKTKCIRQFKDCAKQLELGKRSTIHGVNRIFQENSNNYERLFWFLTLAAALLGSIYVSLILSQKFNAGSFETVVDNTDSPVFLIPFPELTICNANHLNWQRLEEAKHHFMPHENNTEKIRMFELVIGLYDNFTFGEFTQFHALKNKPIELVANINFSLVFDFMTWRCEELLTDCVWRHFRIDCCDIFLKSSGQNGLCWHFNTLSTEEGRRKQLFDNKYPWRTGSAGPQTGLTVRVLLNEEKHYRQDNEKGITLGLMEPEVFHSYTYWVPANTETMVVVEPVIYFYDNDTRAMSAIQRNCVFNDEQNNFNFKTLMGFTYMMENCEIQCYQEYLLKYCNCTLDLLFPPDIYPSCKVKDLLCLAEYNDYFRFSHIFGEEEYVPTIYNGMICNCFRNCFSLNYVSDVRSSFLPAYLRDNKTYVDLDVHFRFETMMVYRTDLVFSWVDLMVSFGGIAGLFLGCSLISAMEFVYFVLVDLPVFLYTKLKSKKQAKHADNQHNNESSLREIPSKTHRWGLNNRIMAIEGLHNNNFSINSKNFNNKTTAALLYK